MTTLTELTTPEIQTTYEPTVADKIQRVLYRLDHGEKLIKISLKSNGSFCVLGLFADESGLGRWESSRYVIDDSVAYSSTDDIVNYYGFNDAGASFDVHKLPNDLQNKVRCLLHDFYDFIIRFPVALSTINDLAVSLKYPHVNQLLADIIRSGVIFN